LLCEPGVVVAYRDADLRYPETAPFNPAEKFPEYPFGPEAVSPANGVYGAVRETLRLAGLDADRFGTPEWNPFRDLVGAGGTVLIKPNWVRHYHLRGETVFSLITHTSVVRPLIDYAYRAVGPEGRVWLMDAPLFDTDYSTLTRVCQLGELEQALRHRGVPLTIADLRSLVAETDRGVVVRRRERNCWDCEGVEFDLGTDSELTELGRTLRYTFGSDYDRRVTASHHALVKGGQKHRYRISKRALEADLVISVPKLKTHKKTGVTLNMKNMIGINTDKNYIPHYRIGAPSHGGDEFPDTANLSVRGRRWLVRHAVDLVLGRLHGERLANVFMRAWLPLVRGRAERRAGERLDPVDVFYRTVQGDLVRTGNWWGNDTCWRTGVDMNKILLYGQLDGRLATRPVRRYFSVIDGIVAGDRDGPLAPRPRPVGVLLAGFDPVSVDSVGTRLMGFDPRSFRDLERASKIDAYPLVAGTSSPRVRSNRPEWDGDLDPHTHLAFQPHPAWAEHLTGQKTTADSETVLPFPEISA